jgi:hypothetical protein
MCEQLHQHYHTTSILDPAAVVSCHCLSISMSLVLSFILPLRDSVHSAATATCRHVCRLRHLEMIRERAALGKDFERRECFPAWARSPSPVSSHHLAAVTVGDAVGDAVGANSSHLEQQEQHKIMMNSASEVGMGGDGNGHLACSEPEGRSPQAASADARRSHCRDAPQPPTNNAAAPLSPSGTTTTTAAAAPAPASPVGAAATLPLDVIEQLRGHSQSLERGGFMPSTCMRTSIKAARRRMAKARRRLLQPA